MEFTDRVLILRIGRFRETDLWVRFLSPQRGVASAFAFGGSRSRRRFSGCLDIFNEVVFSIKTTRGGTYNALQEGLLVRAPQRLRSDWKRLGIAANCAKFLESFGIASDGADKAYTLLAETLQLLEEEEEPPVNLPLLFRARAAFDQGYAVGLSRCPRCGERFAASPGLGFHVREGCFLCAACCAGQAFGKILPARHETLDALARVQEYSPLQWRAGVFASLSASGHKDCARIVDAFIEHHVGLRWDSSRFIRV